MEALSRLVKHEKESSHEDDTDFNYTERKNYLQGKIANLQSKFCCQGQKSIDTGHQIGRNGKRRLRSDLIPKIGSHGIISAQRVKRRKSLSTEEEPIQLEDGGHIFANSCSTSPPAIVKSSRRGIGKSKSIKMASSLILLVLAIGNVIGAELFDVDLEPRESPRISNFSSILASSSSLLEEVQTNNRKNLSSKTLEENKSDFETILNYQDANSPPQTDKFQENTRMTKIGDSLDFEDEEIAQNETSGEQGEFEDYYYWQYYYDDEYNEIDDGIVNNKTDDKGVEKLPKASALASPDPGLFEDFFYNQDSAATATANEEDAAEARLYGYNVNFNNNLAYLTGSGHKNLTWNESQLRTVEILGNAALLLGGFLGMGYIKTRTLVDTHFDRMNAREMTAKAREAAKIGLKRRKDPFTDPAIRWKSREEIGSPDFFLDNQNYMPIPIFKPWLHPKDPFRHSKPLNKRRKVKRRLKKAKRRITPATGYNDLGGYGLKIKEDHLRDKNVNSRPKTKLNWTPAMSDEMKPPPPKPFSNSGSRRRVSSYYNRKRPQFTYRKQGYKNRLSGRIGEQPQLRRYKNMNRDDNTKPSLFREDFTSKRNLREKNNFRRPNGIYRRRKRKNGNGHKRNRLMRPKINVNAILKNPKYLPKIFPRRYRKPRPMTESPPYNKDKFTSENGYQPIRPEDHQIQQTIDKPPPAAPPAGVIGERDPFAKKGPPPLNVADLVIETPTMLTPEPDEPNEVQPVSSFDYSGFGFSGSVDFSTESDDPFFKDEMSLFSEGFTVPTLSPPSILFDEPFVGPPLDEPQGNRDDGNSEVSNEVPLDRRYSAQDERRLPMDEYLYDYLDYNYPEEDDVFINKDKKRPLLVPDFGRRRMSDSDLAKKSKANSNNDLYSTDDYDYYYYDSNDLKSVERTDKISDLYDDYYNNYDDMEYYKLKEEPTTPRQASISLPSNPDISPEISSGDEGRKSPPATTRGRYERPQRPPPSTSTSYNDIRATSKNAKNGQQNAENLHNHRINAQAHEDELRGYNRRRNKNPYDKIVNARTTKRVTTTTTTTTTTKTPTTTTTTTTASTTRPTLTFRKVTSELRPYSFRPTRPSTKYEQRTTAGAAQTTALNVPNPVMGLKRSRVTPADVRKTLRRKNARRNKRKNVSTLAVTTPESFMTPVLAVPSEGPPPAPAVKVDQGSMTYDEMYSMKDGQEDGDLALYGSEFKEGPYEMEEEAVAVNKPTQAPTISTNFNRRKRVKSNQRFIPPTSLIGDIGEPEAKKKFGLFNRPENYNPFENIGFGMNYNKWKNEMKEPLEFSRSSGQNQ